MADPLSVIGGVLTIAGAAIQASRTLFELVDDIREAPEEIRSISRDAHSFYSVVFSLNTTLRDIRIRDIISDDHAMLVMIDNLKCPLSNCEALLAQLMIKMQTLKLGSEGRGDRMRLTYVKWGLFSKSEVRGLQLRLEAAKSTLNSVLNGISVYGVLCTPKCMSGTDKAQDFVGCARWPWVKRSYLARSLHLGCQ